jgi:hypothetical protein
MAIAPSSAKLNVYPRIGFPHISTSVLKFLVFFIVLLPLECFAQFNISGRILNQADSKPMANSNVFLSNATIGSKTAGTGTFTLHNIKPGKYELIVSIVGFETFNKSITVEDSNIELPDIMLLPKTIALKEVSIKYHKDPNREKYYGWFKDEFLGTSQQAQDCKILNPDVLDLDYDEAGNKLTASSYDFLEIENDALGYKIKYLLTNFSFENKDEKKIYYQGPVLFQELKGSPAQERRWQKNREEVYENSPMHFLRAALNDHLTEEGFRVQEYSAYANPQRPSDSLINARISYYKDLKNQGGSQRDSLSYWAKKSKLPKMVYKLQTSPLSKKDIVRSSDKPGQYVLSRNNNWLYVAYSKNHHFHINDQTSYLYNRNNTENTLIKFIAPEAFFNSSGIISNPYSVIFYGVWGRNRVAEMLPVDYEPLKNPIQPGQENLSASIDSALEKYLAVHPTEKTYLQFDKPYYAAGDTIYFKAYVTNGETQQLSRMSGILHVDLINTNNKIDRSIKLQLANGLGWGDFALPDSLPKGNYRIRAYTQWMRNEENYFEQVIPIGSVHNQKVPENAVRPIAVNAKPDIQFMPEGGGLVEGISSKIAFKVVGTNGLGTGVKGVVADNSGKAVCSFSSTHLGMGHFDLKPEEDKTYRVKLTYADGIQGMIDLPKAEVSGIVLSVNNDSIPKASVRIEANKAYFNINKGKSYTLLIYSGGSAITVPVKLDSTVITLDIIKRRLHTGITRIALFSPTNEPLCERLMFVQNYDQLNLSLNSDKPVYNPRGKVSIKLNAKTRTDTADMGHFSVSVIDENKVPVDENTETTILTNLLLTSDLKGTVEQPNYYFTNSNDEKLKELDLVMLTHGYRKFEWKQILSNDQMPIVWQPEKSLQISGTAESLFGRPLAKAPVSLISFVPKSLTSTVADENGKFLFDNLDFNDSIKFVLQAVNARGKNKTKLIYNADKPLFAAPLPVRIDNINTIVPVSYLDNNEKQQEELNKLGLGKGRMIREVKIRDIKLDDKYETQSFAGAGHADQVMHADEIERIGGQLSTSLNGRLRGVNFSKGIPYNGGPMLVVVDGAQVNPTDKQGHIMGFDINLLNSMEVETVEVLRYASAAVYGMNGGNGVLIITTRKTRGLTSKDIASVGILPISVLGYYKAREFYSPKYESAITNTLPDLRSTIYWNPEIQTDKDGNASFTYYNADGKGNYRVVIEGMDEKGNLGRQIYRYKVE